MILGLKGTIAAIGESGMFVFDSPASEGVYLTSSMLRRISAVLKSSVAVPGQSLANNFRDILASLGLPPFEFEYAMDFQLSLFPDGSEPSIPPADESEPPILPALVQDLLASKDGRTDALLIAEWRQRRQERS